MRPPSSVHPAADLEICDALRSHRRRRSIYSTVGRCPERYKIPGAARYACQFYELLLDDRVALACRVLKAKTVSDGYPAACVVDKTSLLQHSRGNGNAGSSDAQHHRQKLVRHRECVALAAVVCHEQPASEALFDMVPTVTGGGHSHLHMERHGVAQHDLPEGRYFFHRAR